MNMVDILEGIPVEELQHVVNNACLLLRSGPNGSDFLGSLHSSWQIHCEVWQS
jgi:hypothetical protein